MPNLQENGPVHKRLTKIVEGLELDREAYRLHLVSIEVIKTTTLASIAQIDIEIASYHDALLNTDHNPGPP